MVDKVGGATSGNPTSYAAPFSNVDGTPQNNVPKGPNTVQPNLIAGMQAFSKVIARGTAAVFGGLTLMVFGLPPLIAKLINEKTYVRGRREGNNFFIYPRVHACCLTVINVCLRIPMLCFGYAKTGAVKGAIHFADENQVADENQASTLILKMFSDQYSSIKEAVSFLCKQKAEDEPPSPFIDGTQKARAFTERAMSELEEMAERHLEAASILLATVQTMYPVSAELWQRALQVAQQDPSDEERRGFVERLQAGELVGVKELFHLSDEFMDTLSQVGRNLMRDKRFADCVKVFSFLCALDPNYVNVLCLGHAAYQTSAYDLAFFSYNVAASLEPESPLPWLWGANVCEKQHQYANARVLLEQAKELAENSLRQDMRDVLPEIEDKLFFMKRHMPAILNLNNIPADK